MKKETLRKQPLDLFLRKVHKDDLPKRGSTLFKKDVESHNKFFAELEKMEYEQEEIEAPLFKAWVDSLGISFEELKEISKKKEEIQRKFHDSFKQIRKDNPDFETYVEPYVMELMFMECKEVTINVCKEKVCINQPVPLTVDDVWVDSGSDGELTIEREYDQFSYEDEVLGYSSWNWTYHRHSRTHEGAINIRSSAELVEPAKVHRIGVYFQPLLNYSGVNRTNGVFADGHDPFGLPPSWGRGKMWRSFQVSVKTPGGNWNRLLPDNNILYKDTGKIDVHISQTVTYPPPMFITLNDDYPAGSQFLIEAKLSYWIKGKGQDATAWAEYALEVHPVMSLEACSWEYPESVTVIINDED